jgi:hypothetical protein
MNPTGIQREVVKLLLLLILKVHHLEHIHPVFQFLSHTTVNMWGIQPEAAK